MSASFQISTLHRAYCDLLGRDLPLNMTAERWWHDALKDGLTVNDLKMVILARQQAVKRGDRREACLLLRNICGSSEAILDCLDEASQVRAKLRCKPTDPARASVLRSAGRPAPVDIQNTAKPVSQLIDDLRRTVQ